LVDINKDDVRWRLAMDNAAPVATRKLKDTLFTAAMEIAGLLSYVEHPAAAAMARQMLEGLYVTAAMADQAARQDSKRRSDNPQE